MENTVNKLDFYDLYEMGYVWFNSQDVIDRLGNKGVRYTLEKRLTDQQKQELLQYDNVRINTCSYKYDCNIVYDTIILLD